VTTGGQMRKFEVPQYTQVSNAVPPLLGYALGQSIKYLIDLNHKS
jgi:DNA (cytosine-5)-methyltransferase 1